MATSGPEHPPQPFDGTEYPSLENSAPQPDPNPPVDYPADAGFPPPVYPPSYPGAAYPGAAYPGAAYPGAAYPGAAYPGAAYPGAAGYYPGYPGAPGYYPGGYDPYQPTKPPGTNGKATAALVTSLVGLFCCGLPSIVGLVLGVIGMRETKRTGQDGYTIALIGAIIGGLAVAGWVIYLLLSISVYASGLQWAP